MILDEFMAQMKRLRTARGLTQSQLAEKVGCSAQQISTIENGKYLGKWLPRLATLDRIADYLGEELVIRIREKRDA